MPSLSVVRKFALLAGILVLLQSNAQESDTDTEQQLTQIAQELNERQNWIGQANREIQSLQDEIQTADQHIAQAAKHIVELKSSISEVEERITEQEKREDEVNGVISDLSASVGLHMNLAYRLQRHHWLRPFFEQDNSAKRDRLMRYHRYFVNASTESIDEFGSLLAEQQEVTTAMRKDRELLSAQHDEWITQQEHYDRDSRRRHDQISLLDEEIQKAQGEVDKLLEDRQRLETLLSEIDSLPQSPVEQVEDEQSTATQGELAWPVEGTVLVNFGDSRADGRLTWEGVHIAADTGTDVIAVAQGDVVFADWLRGFGMMIVLDHGGDVVTIYGNCETLFAKVGENVEAGEVIASVGQSGGQSVPGLYFEVRTDDISVDPLEWIKQRED